MRNGQQMQKYLELEAYMEQYVKNTNEVQAHFMTTVQKLKKENEIFRNELQENTKNQKEEQEKYEGTIKILENSLNEHLNINNKICTELEKTKKILDKTHSEQEESLRKIRQLQKWSQNKH